MSGHLGYWSVGRDTDPMAAAKTFRDIRDDKQCYTQKQKKGFSAMTTEPCQAKPSRKPKKKLIIRDLLGSQIHAK